MTDKILDTMKICNVMEAWGKRYTHSCWQVAELSTIYTVKYHGSRAIIDDKIMTKFIKLFKKLKHHFTQINNYCKLYTIKNRNCTYIHNLQVCKNLQQADNWVYAKTPILACVIFILSFNLMMSFNFFCSKTQVTYRNKQSQVLGQTRQHRV